MENTLQKTIEFLNEKWNNKNGCPMCGWTKWNVADKVYELREFNNWSLIVWWGPIFPVIPVSCENCWKSIMINAVISWTIKNKKK
jgi:hypothetical protein